MDCRIRDCRVVCREGSIVSAPPVFFWCSQLTQSTKCYMKIQWHMFIGRKMGLPPLVTLIYFNWKH